MPVKIPKAKPLKDPEGGLTAAGRKHFKKTEGSTLKPGVRGKADTPDKQRRKGSFLRRHYGRKTPSPLVDDSGKPTRYALQAHAWGETVPRTRSDVKRLAAKGSALLEKYARKSETTGTRAKSSRTKKSR